MFLSESVFEEARRAEKIWASLPGYNRKAILTKLGHTEFCAMTADAMRIVDITVRFGRTLGEGIYKEVLGHAL